MTALVKVLPEQTAVSKYHEGERGTLSAVVAIFVCFIESVVLTNHLDAQAKLIRGSCDGAHIGFRGSARFTYILFTC